MLPGVGGRAMQAPGDVAFCFGAYTLDLRRGSLRAGDREIGLRPKSFAVLRHLVERAGRLVSKDDIIAAVWPEVVATDESVARCISEVRLALDDGSQGLIKTVPRRGYLFAAPVSSPPEMRPGEPQDVEGSETPRISLVVLPFVNRLGGTLPDHFVDAITDGLTADLARLPDAFVIARTTAFIYKNKAIDVRQLGRDLGVRYVVAGSVQTGPDRVRVSTELIDARTAARLWGDCLDQRRAGLFEMQDAITARLARMVGIELIARESGRAARRRSGDVDSRDLSLRGRAILNRPMSWQAARSARGLFEDALRLDGRNIDALVGLAWAHIYDVSNWLSDCPAGQTQAAEAAISRALALDPSDANVRFVRASVWQISRPPEVALRGFELVTELDPHHAAARAAAGLVRIYLGRPEETEAHVNAAIKLSPRDPRSHVWHGYAGIANLFLGRVDGAVDRLRKALELNPGHELAHFYLAAALTEAKQRREAAMVCEAARRVAPSFGIAKYLSETRSADPVYLAQRQRVVQLMRDAGIPDGAT
jgi:TolB-like protein/tetratricopeptide (TPR) repeat protein